MTDNDSVRSSAKPRGGRPAPSGPRVRQQSSFTNLLSLDAISNHRDSSATSSSRDSTLYSPGPSSPRIPTTPTRNSVEPPPPGETKLAVITESPTATSPPSPSPPPQFTQSSEPNDTAPTLTPSSRPTSREIPSRPPSRVPSPSPSPSPSPVPRARVVSKQTTVLPPPQIKFESTQIQWKGLPLEAALWTLDSRDLQVIVSRAIRSSAQESFIRLLSTKQLDEELPTELDRLKSLKAMTQARYRFNAQRRSMLLQALMSFSESGDNKQDSVGPTVGRLAVQLSETTIECDKLSQELVAIMDQINQVQRLLDVHWASALAIALRKLNGSYGKRTAELNQSRQRITQLEGELEDAWKEAEKMAQEIDDINAMDSDEEDEEDISRVVIQKAQVISVPQSAKPVYVSSPSAPPSAPSSASPDKSSFDKETKIDTAQLPPPGSAVGSAFPISPDVEDEDDGDAASLRSRKSAKSFGAQSRVSAVSAARKRSLRTSMGSLRLPVRTLSLVNLQRHPPVHPPVPAIPKKFSPGGALSPSTSAAPVEALHSLHGLKKRNGSDISLVDETLTAGQFEDVKNSRRISIDELNIETSAVPHLPGAQYMPRRERPTSVMDDLYLSTRAPSSIGHTEEDSGMNIGGVGVGFLLGGLGGVSGLGFGSGSYGPYSTPAARKRRGSVDEQSIIANARRIGKDRQAQSIPSIWMNADVTPSTTSRSSRAQSPDSEPKMSNGNGNDFGKSRTTDDNDHDADDTMTQTNGLGFGIGIGIGIGIGNERVFSPPLDRSTSYPTPIITETSILRPNRYDETKEEASNNDIHGYLQSPDSMLSPSSAKPVTSPSATSPGPVSSSSAGPRSPLARSNSKSARDKFKTFSRRISMSGMGFPFQIPGHGKHGKEGKDGIDKDKDKDKDRIEEDGDGDGHGDEELEGIHLQRLDEEEMGYRVPRHSIDDSNPRPGSSRSTPIIGRRGSVYKRSMKSRSSVSTTSFLSLK